MVVIPKIIQRFYAIAVQIPTEFFIIVIKTILFFFILRQVSTVQFLLACSSICRPHTCNPPTSASQVLEL